MATWPVVQPDDPGIRPAGKPDACFYCDRKVGEEHGRECVIVNKVVKLRYVIECDVLVPHFWDKGMVEFHRNDSSWCCNNAVHDIQAQQKDGDCLCDRTVTEFITVVDATPRVS